MGQSDMRENEHMLGLTETVKKKSARSARYLHSLAALHIPVDTDFDLEDK